jgi:hypothetical protein
VRLLLLLLHRRDGMETTGVVTRGLIAALRGGR